MDFPPTTWRLIETPPANGAWNMAVDEILLAGAQRPGSLPVLRLYSWAPPCLSLGYGQSPADADLNRLAQFGWDLVRRPTGGKAILHTDELTYSVIGSQQDPRLAGGILESYLTLANALAAALYRVGLEVQITAGNMPEIKENPLGAVCFEVPSAYEITASGRKLVGSAQARKGEAFLQHGTIPLQGDISRITEVLSYQNDAERAEAARRVRTRATTLEQEIGRSIGWGEMAQALKSAFGEKLNLKLDPSDLTDAEIAGAEEIAALKLLDLEVE